MPLRKFVAFEHATLDAIRHVLENAGDGGEKNQRDDVPRVGEYFADYSALTPEEIAETDSECLELFGRSKPVSR